MFRKNIRLFEQGSPECDILVYTMIRLKEKPHQQGVFILSACTDSRLSTGSLERGVARYMDMSSQCPRIFAMASALL
jgi:hypothetical protein